MMDVTAFEEKSKLGVLLFLASEATFFLFLIVAYAYFNYGLTQAPTASTSLHPLRTGLYTIALLASSGTLFVAERRLVQDDQRGFRGWTALTVVLGAIFLLGQTREYLALLRDNVSISRNLFGTSFFTLTGLHGFHVFIGLVLLVVLFGTATSYRSANIAPVQAIAYYWHFVDAVWIVIFSVIYLWSARAL